MNKCDGIKILELDPIWTGTEAEYNQLTKVAGMTYNIIDEESA